MVRTHRPVGPAVTRDFARSEDPLFAYDDAVAEQYPAVRVAVVRTTRLVNRPSSAVLLEEYRAEQYAVTQGLQVTPIATMPSIAAWRRAFTQFGAKPTQHRNAVEALLRRLDKQGDIPSISTVVDIGNLVAIRHALPVAAFDLANVSGSMTVRFATGDEWFIDLGSSDRVHPEPGEVIFVDRQDVVHARRWCWRQSAQSATSPTTTDALFVIEGHHDTAGADVTSAAANLTALLVTHQPGAQTAQIESSGTDR